MAQEVQIAGTDAKAKIRSPWAPALLPFVTFFIYYWVWYYRINREMRDYGRAKGSTELGDSPGMSLLAVTLGAVIIVPAVLSTYNTAKRIQNAQKLASVEPLNGWLALVMYLIISPVFFAYEQAELNKVWRTDSEAPRIDGGQAAGTVSDMGTPASAPAQTEPVADPTGTEPVEPTQDNQN